MKYKVFHIVPVKFKAKTIPDRLYGSLRIGSPSPMSTSKTGFDIPYNVSLKETEYADA